ncbi:SusC/RagA family TonB-linked outer membrane protein [Parabacteroides johnsonii]|nr:TonB-dependent receptor [Parabacteroides johnsonii]
MMAYASPGTVKGKVIGSDGYGIAGVNVIEKGTTNGVITDVEGRYVLNLTTENPVIAFSFIGYVSQELSVGNKTVVDIVLKEDVKALEEVVVVGYGTQKKKDLTGAIASVNSEDLGKTPALSFDQSLQGKVAGVQISQTNGAPGGNINIMVRGISSITGSNSPLYVVDGFPIGTGGGGSNLSNFSNSSYSSSGMANATTEKINPLSTINPSDIESIEILKDASATAIYGSRGANGVVLITTKKGKTGKTSINVNASFGVQQVAHKLDLLTPREYAEFVAEGRDNAWIYAGGQASDPNEVRTSNAWVRPEYRNPSSISNEGTDWQDVIFRLATVQNYQVSATGGTENIKYMVSLGFFDQKGIVIGSDFQRFNIRSNIEAKLTKRLKFGTNLAGSYGYGDFARTEGHLGLRGMIQCALAINPGMPVYGQDGSYNSEFDDPMGAPVENPLFIAENFSDKRNMKDFIVNNYLDYEFIPGLNFRTSFGLKFNLNQTELWKSSKIGTYADKSSPATAAAIDKKGLNWLNENTLTYKKNFNEKHDLNVVAGLTVQKDTYSQLSAGATDFPTDYIHYLSAGTINSGTHLKSEWSMVSLLARANYVYDNKYMLTATVRRDGSSRFGANQKWGTFPSVSVGYRVSEEPFMQNFRALSDLKIRASYGVAGNNSIGNYNQIALLGVSNYVDANKILPGLAPSTLANDELTWEKSKQTDIGIDFGLFNNRVSVIADWYYNLKTDLLLSVNLPAASGFGSAMQNVGEIENKGFEFALNTVNIDTKNFSWSTSFNISTNRNKVKKLATEDGRIVSDKFITEVGQPISSFYMMNVVGVFKDDADVAKGPVYSPNTRPGDLKYEDVDGDGKITTADKTIVGSPFPDFTWGLNNEFKWKNLSLSVFVNGSQGGKTYFEAGETLLNCAGVQNQLSLVNDRWRSPEEPGNGYLPRAIRSDYALGMSASSRYLFDASYVRIKDITLSYDFPGSITQKIGLKGLNAYFNVSNVYTFTDYPGYDPEASQSGDSVTSAGIDSGVYPTPRTYTLGVKVAF